MHVPTLWACMQASKALRVRAIDKRLCGIVPQSRRKQGLPAGLDEHRGKFGSAANLVRRNKPFATVGSHICHLVTLPLPSAGRTSLRSAKRCAYRRDRQSKDCQHGKHGYVCRPRTNWNRLVHSFFFTSGNCFQAFNAPYGGGQTEKQFSPSLGGIMVFAKKPASHTFWQF
jgi:hypothetical protein